MAARADVNRFPSRVENFRLRSRRSGEAYQNQAARVPK